ncbi:hypothetical protein H0H93_001822 [Arthromyces matolae]|nr:hypothetical protein H0H93_001822 [Arthromyces matolae]
MGVHENKCFDRRNTSCQRPEEIIHLGSDAYTDALQKMMLKISDEADSVGEYENELAKLGEPADGESEQVTQERQQFQNDLMKAKRSIKNTEIFYKDVTNHWTLPIQRTLGHVVYSPPVSLSKGEEEYTEDWALIKIKRNKIDWDSFPGNKIYIGESIPPSTFVSKMHPHPQGRSSFKFPLGGFLQVKGVITKEELRKPEQLDDNGEPCLLAIKNGMKTGDTIGRANGIESVVRHYGPGVSGISRELAIFPYSAKDGPFSAAGDSGALIVDGNGRIVGVLTGGSGATDTTDVTYATPFWWLEQQIKKVFPDSFLYPIVD